MNDVLELVEQQADDEALWLEPRDPQAAVLQTELRMLHDAIRRMEDDNK